MKPKSKISKDDLLADGTVFYGYDSHGRLWERGKLVEDKPPEPKADVVERPIPKTNVAPSDVPPTIFTTPKSPKLPEATRLQRAINANIVAQNGKTTTSPAPKRELHGIELAIAANIRDQKSKNQ